MNSRQNVLKSFMHREMRKAKIAGKTEDAAALQAVLDDSDGLFLCCVEMHVERQMAGPDDVVLAPVDEVIKFLQWLLDHTDELINFIKQIIALFS